MQTRFSFFLSAVSKSAKRAFVFVLFLVLTGAATPEATPPSAPSAPSAQGISLLEIPVSEVAGTASNGPHNLGDRIYFQATPAAGLIEPGQTLTIKLADEQQKPEETGWYVDPSTLNQNGTLRFIASPLKSGSLTLPSLLISVGDGSPFARTQPITLNIIGPTDPGTGKPDLIDVISISLPFRYWIYGLLVLLLLLTGVAFGIRYYLKHRAPPKPEALPILPVEPDHVVALKRLESLFAAHPFSLENLKFVSFGISEILKAFFSSRFKMDALESTTDEMISLLRKEALSAEQLREIQTLFLQLDQFKFTKVESFPRVDEEDFLSLRLKTQLIIQKWALTVTGGELKL